jgi:tRNA threonylcarbamoyl adenosine modification protein (Sua5/YciO/YrdC/YwlC family)
MRYELHPENPQARLIAQIVDRLRAGELMIYPTDSTYAYGWLPTQKTAQDRVAKIRKLDGRHLYALACKDLKQASEYGKIDNRSFAMMKAHTPGPYTFILPATSALPKRLMHEKRRTIGIRVPENAIVQTLLAALDEPLMTSSLTLPTELDPLYTPDELFDATMHQVDFVIDGGHVGYEPTTLVDLSTNEVSVIRAGRGSITSL